MTDDIKFNGHLYREIHIPINHINFDKEGRQRSSYSVEEIAELLIDQLNGLFIENDGTRDGKDFYVYKFYDLDKRFKLVFSTEDTKIFIRVITLHRIR